MSTYHNRLRAELVEAARRQERKRFTLPALPRLSLGGAVAVAAAACIVIALVLVAGRGSDGLDRIDRAAKPGPPPVAVQGARVRDGMTLIIDPDRYTLESADGEIKGDVAVAGGFLVFASTNSLGCAGTEGGVYDFTVDGSRLELELVRDGCAARAEALPGVWRRGG